MLQAILSTFPKSTKGGKTSRYCSNGANGGETLSLEYFLGDFKPLGALSESLIKRLTRSPVVPPETLQGEWSTVRNTTYILKQKSSSKYEVFKPQSVGDLKVKGKNVEIVKGGKLLSSGVLNKGIISWGDGDMWKKTSPPPKVIRKELPQEKRKRELKEALKYLAIKTKVHELSEHLEGKNKEIARIEQEKTKQTDLSERQTLQIEELKTQLQDQTRELETTHQNLCEANKQLADACNNQNLCSEDLQDIVVQKDVCLANAEQECPEISAYRVRELSRDLDSQTQKRTETEERLAALEQNYATTKTQLATTEDQLTTTAKQLTFVESQLCTARNELATKRLALKKTVSLLEATSQRLCASEADVTRKSAEITQLSSKLDALQTELTDSMRNSEQKGTEIVQLSNDLEDARSQLSAAVARKCGLETQLADSQLDGRQKNAKLALLSANVGVMRSQLSAEISRNGILEQDLKDSKVEAEQRGTEITRLSGNLEGVRCELTATTSRKSSLEKDLFVTKQDLERCQEHVENSQIERRSFVGILTENDETIEDLRSENEMLAHELKKQRQEETVLQAEFEEAVESKFELVKKSSVEISRLASELKRERAKSAELEDTLCHKICLVM